MASTREIEYAIYRFIITSVDPVFTDRSAVLYIYVNLPSNTIPIIIIINSGL